MDIPPHDPDDTQPIPAQPVYARPIPPSTASPGAVPPGPIPLGTLPAYGLGTSAGAATRFVHPFGNVGVYLLARFGAFLIDIFAVTFLFATFGLQMSTGGNLAFGGHDATSFTLLMLVSLGAAALLLVISEGLFGTSLGKLVFGLHVRRTNGNWVGPGRALLRTLLLALDVLLVGPILAAATPRHQRVGDFFAGTVVGRSRIGWLSTLLGLAILALVGYAQILYGGGVTTALTVAAEGATYFPQFYRAASVPFAAVPTASPYALPTAAPQNATAAPDATPAAPSTATDAPANSPTDAPAGSPTDTPADSTPAATETG
jgi:uncharacterized RDD family membrane protein YckC